MSKDYSRTILIDFNDGEGIALKSFKTASRAKSTAVTIELDVTDGYALERLLGDLHRSRQPKAKPAPTSRLALTDRTRRSLPSPLLSLPYFGDEE